MMDLAIVGSGPAGSFAALEAVKAGLDVVLIDKKSIRYGPIVCGELLPSKELLSKYIPRHLSDLLAYTLDSTLTNDVILNRIRRLNVVIGDESIGTFPFDSLVIDKGAMIAHVIDEAENRGATVMFSATVTNCEAGARQRCVVKGRGGESIIEARRIMGADAYPSILSKAANATNFSPRDLIVATSQRALGKFDEEEAIIIMDPKLAPGGYAWIFPRGDGSLNTGLGVRGDAAWSGGNDLLELHRRFIERFNLKPIQRGVLSKTIPVGGLINASGDAYLVGDAVGSVIPTNGAGINPAMITSKLAIDAIHNGSDYYMKLNEAFGPFMRKMTNYRRIADPFLYDHDLMKRLLKLPRPMLRIAMRDAVMGSTRKSSDLLISILGPLIHRKTALS